MTTTPNMGLTKPSPSVTPGPQWANELNASLDKIDTHDHSSGNGSKITPAGLNINSDLTLAANALTNVKNVGLTSVVGAGISNIYQNGGNLFWRNGSGADVRITNGSTIDVGALGTIGGDYSTDPNNPLISFSTASGDYDFFKQTAGSNIPGGINSGTITVFEEIAGALGISIASPTSLAAGYTITLPTGQAGSNNSLINVQASGQWSYVRDITVDSIGAGAGSEAAPSVYRETDTGTGMWFPSASVLAFSTGGSRSWNINSSGNFTATGDRRVQAGNGSAANPTFSFGNDVASGMYLPSTNLLGFATGGTERFRMGLSSFVPIANDSYSLGGTVNTFSRIFMGDGSLASPSYTFGTSSNTGIYQSSAGTLDFGANGSRKLTLGTYVQVQSGASGLTNIDGSAGAPSFTFSSDTDTGMFRVASNQLGFSAGGTQGMRMTAAELVPGAAGVQNLGSSATRWNITYAETIDVSGTGTNSITGNSVALSAFGNTVTVNSSGVSLGGTLIGTLENGTYTPSITNSAGTTTVGNAMYSRVGDIVTVTMDLNITTNGSGSAIATVSLPVSSSLTSLNDLIGQLRLSNTISNDGSGGVFGVEAATSTNRLFIQISGAGASTSYNASQVQFQYEVK